MNKVRIGIVGVGKMGQCAHLKNYAILPDCEVVAIAEPREELGRKVAARYGVVHVYKTHTDMLDAETVDGIVAAQPFDRHGVLVPELLKAGVPVFTEKPLAASVEVGEKLVEAARAHGTWQMVGYNKRSDPATMYAKAEIDRLKETKELGPLRYVRIIMPEGDYRVEGFSDMVRTDEPKGGLEVDPPPSDMDEQTYKSYVQFVNYYIHQVNLLRHLLGEPYRVAYADPSGVLMAVESESGVAGTVEMTPYKTTLDWQESALIAFEHGYVKLNLPAPMAMNRPGTVEILRYPGGGVTPETIFPQLPWIHSMRQQAANFVSAIKGDMKPLCDSEEALEDLRVAREYIRLLKGR